MDPPVGSKSTYMDTYTIELLEKKRRDPGFRKRKLNEIEFGSIDPSMFSGLSESEIYRQKWYFFCKADYMNKKSEKPEKRKRKTKTGYWKSTGKSVDVLDEKLDKIGSKRTLSFHVPKAGLPESQTITSWVMHEFSVKRPDVSQDYVICCVKKKPNKKARFSSADGRPSTGFVSNSVNHDVEDSSTKFLLQVQYQRPSSRPLISDTGNHNTESTIAEVAPQPVSSKNLFSDSRDHVAINIFQKKERQEISSQNLIDVVANSYLKVDLPQPSSQHAVFHPTNHATEKTTTDVCNELNVNLTGHYGDSALGTLTNHAQGSDFMLSHDYGHKDVAILQQNLPGENSNNSNFDWKSVLDLLNQYFPTEEPVATAGVQQPWNHSPMVRSVADVISGKQLPQDAQTAEGTQIPEAEQPSQAPLHVQGARSPLATLHVEAAQSAQITPHYDDRFQAYERQEEIGVEDRSSKAMFAQILSILKGLTRSLNMLQTENTDGVRAGVDIPSGTMQLTRSLNMLQTENTDGVRAGVNIPSGTMQLSMQPNLGTRQPPQS